jgi:hypothetical protein
MSSIANLGSTPAALPQLDLRPHGHKKGLSGSDAAPQPPVRARQNIFANLLQSLEQAIGLQLTTPAAAAPVSPAVTGSSGPGTAAGITAAGSTAGANLLNIAGSKVSIRA